MARFKIGKVVDQDNLSTELDKNGLPSTSSPAKNGILSQAEQNQAKGSNVTSKSKKDTPCSESSPPNGTCLANPLATVEAELISLAKYVQDYHPPTQQDGCSNKESDAKTEKWSLKEARLFSHALETYGKNFGAIKKALTWKPAKKIIEHYYKKGNNNGGNSGGNGGSSSGQGDDDDYGSEDENLDSMNSPGENNASTTADGGSNTSGTSNSLTASLKSNNNINPKGSYSSQQKLQVACFTSTQMTNEPFASLTQNGLFTSSTSPLNHLLNFTENPINGHLSTLKNNHTFLNGKPEENHFSNMASPPLLVDNAVTGAEVKAMKAKPIYKIEETELPSIGSNSVVGSLKFFMDGQFVLKLNAKQKESDETKSSSTGKCLWVESQDTPKFKKGQRNKRFTKHKHSSDAGSLDSTGKSLTNESSGSSGRASVVSEDTGEEEESSDDDVASLGSSESRSLPSPSLSGLTPRKGLTSSRTKTMDYSNSHIPVIPSPLLINSKCSSPSDNKTPNKSKDVKRDFSVFAFEDDTPSTPSHVTRSPLGSPAGKSAKSALTLSTKKRFKSLVNGSVFSRPEDRLGSSPNSSLNMLRNHAPLPSSNTLSALDLSSPRGSSADDCAVDLSVVNHKRPSSSSSSKESTKVSPDRKDHRNHHPKPN